jgi:hypothetical protein
MDINKIGQAGIKLDLWFHTLNQKYNKASKTHNWAYGRGLEQASGMGYWFIALTMLFGGGYGVESETIQINNFLWAWMAATLGYCQIYYNGLPQRKVFNLMATTGWITIAISAFVELGGWNLLTAVSLPYCLCSFYLYGFLVGPQGDKE